ncbi:hypothetical protein RM533_09595 [Croceicoccus sp. F390]|uniref:Uncharacterized protein n=2 Tax=Croceicoccus esteveae TaxID=3075597 RepID=A0ABU2ZJQ0_9SPHN|nr:hypothetical protein [Croceicoccus sp. F390]MDT0576441.1 hypothetical protein [Croceicoccus sp. F390]
MTFMRALTLVCFSFGLFVQVAANAAALPQVETVEMGDCTEMAESSSGHVMDAQQKSSDREGPCSDMTLECLVAMNCLPPLALSGAATEDGPTLLFAPSYLVPAVTWLEREHSRPESPPPQTTLTV